MTPHTKTIACIHTSMVFLTVETMMQDLFEEILPDIRLINIVDDSLLPDVMKRGSISPDVQARMTAYVQAAEHTGADLVFSLCSSLGPTIDEARKHVSIPVVKIDDAMAESAARVGGRIAVMATVPTTLGPTVDLIREKALEIDADVEILPILVEGAFQLLMGGQKQAHDAKVLDAAAALGGKADLIVFAQASMTRLAPDAKARSGLEVLTSPRLGIQSLRDKLFSE